MTKVLVLSFGPDPIRVYKDLEPVGIMPMRFQPFELREGEQLVVRNGTVVAETKEPA